MKLKFISLYYLYIVFSLKAVTVKSDLYRVLCKFFLKHNK
ncbi:hypothetical protein HMPREF1333_02344 [Enterococcus faecalis ERV37]|nr:hypothetical protein HMPREF1333_02344 [Enterococcus faecalis ERV37]EJV26561.1 hypothetical protein HMPREF1340_02284 [Enterococcus faecalis ERV73]